MSPSTVPRRVRVVVAGEVGPALAASFAPLVAHSGAGVTVLEGVTADVDSLLVRISDLGLTLRELETDPPPEP